MVQIISHPFCHPSQLATSPLREVVLGTDTLNKSATRAYERARMAETRSFSSSRTMHRQIALVHGEP